MKKYKQIFVILLLLASFLLTSCDMIVNLNVSETGGITADSDGSGLESGTNVPGNHLHRESGTLYSAESDTLILFVDWEAVTMDGKTATVTLTPGIICYSMTTGRHDLFVTVNDETQSIQTPPIVSTANEKKKFTFSKFTFEVELGAEDAADKKPKYRSEAGTEEVSELDSAPELDSALESDSALEPDSAPVSAPESESTPKAETTPAVIESTVLDISVIWDYDGSYNGQRIEALTVTARITFPEGVVELPTDEPAESETDEPTDTDEPSVDPNPPVFSEHGILHSTASDMLVLYAKWEAISRDGLTATVKMDIGIVCYSLSTGRHKLTVKVNDQTKTVFTRAIENTVNEKKTIKLYSLEMEIPLDEEAPNLLDLAVVWEFNGSYSGQHIKELKVADLILLPGGEAPDTEESSDTEIPDTREENERTPIPHPHVEEDAAPIE